MARCVRFLAPLLAAAGSAMAAEIEPVVELGVLRTDNLTLTSVDPLSETIWRLAPSLRVTQESTRISADAIYQMEAFHYDDIGESEVHNFFDGTLAVGLVPERFLYNVGVSRTQAIKDPQSTIPPNNFVLTGNLVDLDQYFMGPELRFPLGQAVVLEADWRRTKYRYSEPVRTTDNYDYDDGSFGIDNFAAGRGFAWALRYDTQRAEYDVVGVPPYEYRQAAVELGAWSSASTRWFVAGGKESAWDDPLDPSLEDAFWEVGFQRTVAERLSAEFAVGDRSFGSSGRLIVDYDFGRGDTAFSYTEVPTTNSADRYLRGGLLDPDQPPDYLFQPDGVERFIAKRLQWSLSVELDRSGINFTVFDESREERTQLDGVALPDETQSGGNVAFTWRFGPRLSLTAAVLRADRDFADEGRSKLSTDSLTADYRLGARTTLLVSYEQWEDRSSTGAGVNYEAEVVTASVSRTFGRQ